MKTSPRGALMGAALRRASSGGSPAWASEIQRTTGTYTSGSSMLITLTGGVAVGQRVVVMVACGYSLTVSSVADSQGNTWGIDQQISNPVRAAIVSAPVTTALSSGDTITVTFTSGPSEWRGAIVIKVDNTTALDVAGNASNYSTAPTKSVTTTAATAMVGMLASNNTLAISATDGTQSGSVYSAGIYMVPIYKNASSSGSNSIGATITINNWNVAIAAYK